ncbi:hypothetical protein [uncultured Nostoc sp.]|uniref:hypothetical protein n=1 Tax=uncultured Nostoc sp. TaxID=340711 RepID=UPI0035CA0E36
MPKRGLTEQYWEVRYRLKSYALLVFSGIISMIAASICSSAMSIAPNRQRGYCIGWHSWRAGLD